jgi:tetratricopeptide (TPR) repeat protein
MSAATAAREFYEKGHVHVARHDFLEMERAASYLNAAIAKDPSFAPAYSDLARAYLFQMFYQAQTISLTAQAEAAAASAVGLDATSADAHTTLGAVRAVFAWDWAGARQEFRRALELDPNLVQAHEWYAVLYLLPHGDFAGAHSELERARQLDPAAASLVANEGFVNMLERQYSRSIESSRLALEMDPASAPAFAHLLNAFWLQGNYGAWIAAHEKATQVWYKLRIDDLRRVYAEKGAAALVRVVLDEQLSAEGDHRAAPSGATAVMSLTAGRPDIAMRELEECFPRRDFSLIYLKIDPNFDALRGNARFQEMVRRIGL